MNGVETKACRSCRAPMIWTVSPSLAALPIDAKPVAIGEYVVDSRLGGIIRLRKATPEDAPLERYTSHFRTCSAPSAHSRKRKGS